MKCAWKELLNILPQWMREEVDRVGRNTLQEIRLRQNKPVVLIKSDHNAEIRRPVTQEDLHYVVNASSRYSPWTATTASQGYITASGGHRVGLCGDAIIRDERMQGIGTIRSINIRVARDFPGISGNLWLRKGSLLILGPPGSGKTTLLRDLIRKRSQHENISVVDERGEIFPAAAGFIMGENTDVLTGCSKSQGIDIVLRMMSPQCIAMDEITASNDCAALVQAGWCGVSLLATAHAASVKDFNSRPVYAPLVSTGLFEWGVVLQSDKSWTMERIVL